MNEQLLNVMNQTRHKDWPVPDIAGAFAGKNLLIVGSARCVWDDLARVGASAKGYYEVMAINDIIMHLNLPIRHAVSNDNKWLPKWIAARRPYYREQMDCKQPIMTHSNKPGPGIDHAWPLPGTGTSGLTAVQVGVALGYDSIILAGIPMDGTDHYYDPLKGHPLFYDSHNYGTDNQLKYWKRAKTDYFEGKVKSLSGNTKDLLGAP